MLRIEVQRLAESTSSSEKFEPRDVHELCRPHDADSRSARDVMRVRRSRKRLQRFSLATPDGSSPACGGQWGSVWGCVSGCQSSSAFSAPEGTPN